MGAPQCKFLIGTPERLQQIYDQFTEGFATPDLRDAKTLLDELGITGGPRP